MSAENMRYRESINCLSFVYWSGQHSFENLVISDCVEQLGAVPLRLGEGSPFHVAVAKDCACQVGVAEGCVGEGAVLEECTSHGGCGGIGTVQVGVDDVGVIQPRTA